MSVQVIKMVVRKLLHRRYGDGWFISTYEIQKKEKRWG